MLENDLLYFALIKLKINILFQLSIKKKTVEISSLFSVHLSNDILIKNNTTK